MVGIYPLTEPQYSPGVGTGLLDMGLPDRRNTASTGWDNLVTIVKMHTLPTMKLRCRCRCSCYHHGGGPRSLGLSADGHSRHVISTATWACICSPRLGGDWMMYVGKPVSGPGGAKVGVVLILPALGPFRRSQPLLRETAGSAIPPSCWAAASHAWFCPFSVWVHHFFTMGQLGKRQPLFRHRDHVDRHSQPS